MRDGFPFAVSFSSRHKKSRNHYMQAIEMRRRIQNSGELNVILVVSMENVVTNYNENVRLMKNASSMATEGIVSNTASGGEVKNA